MLKKLLATTALFAIGTGAAVAADAALPYTKAPAASPSYNWSGFYIGGNIGGAASGGRVTDDPSGQIGNGNGDGLDLFKSGVTGGVQAGYNWQVTPNWVVGVEGDINALDSKRSVCELNDCSSDGPLITTTKTDYLSTIRGRAGVTWDRSLIYLTGGLAIGRVTDAFNDKANPINFSTNAATRTGYAVGAGVETALTGNWSLKAEYLYANLGGNRVNDNDGDVAFLDFTHEYHIGRVGLNYRFGAPAEVSVAEAAPRYTKAPVAAATAYNWSGFYLGGNIGGAASGGAIADTNGLLATGDTPGDSIDLFKSGFTLGGQAGYNWQVAPNWVLGVEGDISALGANRSVCDLNDCGNLILATRTDYLSTIRGRVGYAWDRSLVYVTGGLAIARVVDSFNDFNNPSNNFSINAATRTGYAVGAGIETAVRSNWSIKAEYLYANLGTNRVNDNDGSSAFLDFTHEYHIGRIGLNYHFNGPVVAKY